MLADLTLPAVCLAIYPSAQALVPTADDVLKSVSEHIMGQIKAALVCWRCIHITIIASCSSRVSTWRQVNASRVTSRVTGTLHPGSLLEMSIRLAFEHSILFPPTAI